MTFSMPRIEATRALHLLHAARRARGMLLLLLVFVPLCVLPAQSSPGDVADLARHVSRLTTAARVANLELEAARLARAAARARRDASGFAGPITLQASIADGPRFDPAAGNGKLEISRGIFTGARQAADRSRAEADLSIASAELLAKEAALEMDVVRTTARAVGALRISRRLERGNRLLTQSEEALRSRFEIGEARYLDVLRMRAERLQARIDIASARAEWTGAVARLALLVAGGLDSAALVAVLDSASSDELAARWSSLLVARIPLDSIVGLFPAVRTATAEETRARVGLVELRAAQRSQVVGSVGVQRIGPANGGASFGAVLGVSATLPSSARQANELAIVSATGALEAARGARAAAEAGARASMRSSRARFAAAIERLDSFDAGMLEAAESERETAISQYRAGTLPLLDLLDFERALQRVDVARTRAVIDAAEALAILHGLTAYGEDRP